MSPESRYEELKDLIEIAYIGNRWSDSKEEEKKSSLDLLKDIQKIVNEKIEYIEQK